MNKLWSAGFALAWAALPVAVLGQEGAVLDCAVSSLSSETKGSLGAAMAGAGDESSRDLLFQELAAASNACMTRHSVAETHKDVYFNYNLSRISREWLAVDIAKVDLSTTIVDKALDFGPEGANPDLTEDMSEEHIMKIVQAYIDTGVDIEQVDAAVWEKVGAYAAATSIYWNNRKLLPF